MLDFERCDISGQLRATGKKGYYWIHEGAWTYLTFIEFTTDGAVARPTWTFNDVEEAEAAANRLEE